MRSKDLQQLIKDAENQGWCVSLTSKGHYKWQSPSGNFFFSASTPSDHRAIKYIKQYLMRYGFITISKKGKNSRG